MAASNKRREDEGIAMFDVVEFDGPGVGACATTSATTRHNSTAISVGGDVFVPAHVHTCICTYVHCICLLSLGRTVKTFYAIVFLAYTYRLNTSLIRV